MNFFAFALVALSFALPEGGRGGRGRGNGGRGDSDSPNCRGKIVSGGYSSQESCPGRCRPTIDCYGNIVYIPSGTPVFG
jgi:hypothetical protein